MKISGSLIVLTGASQGIGAAAAKVLAAKGGRIALLARSEDKLHEVATQIKSNGGEAYVFPVDLSDPKEIEQVTLKIIAELGTPDILINNAGSGRWLFVEETSPQENQMMMSLPYFAAFNLCHYFLPSMLKRRSGLIINLNSPVSRLPWPGSTGYACSRWALRGLTECLRTDLFKTGVKVSEVIPGEVNSNYFDNNPGVRERLPSISKIYPVLEPEDVAKMLVTCIERDKKEVVSPFLMRATILSTRFFPSLTRWLLIYTGWKH